jgi:hypothetical protein
MSLNYDLIQEDSFTAGPSSSSQNPGRQVLQAVLIDILSHLLNDSLHGVR